MNELEVTWSRTLSVYWAMAWRGVIFLVFGSYAIKFVIVKVVVAFGGHAKYLQVHLGIFELVYGVVVGIWLLRVALRLSYPGFRIALVPNELSVLEARVAKQSDAAESAS